MICRKCGTPLKENDKFCSKCGARVIKEPLAMSGLVTQGESETEYEPETKFKGYTPPEEGFDWNINGFPTEHRPTEEVDFNWHTFDSFHKEWIPGRKESEKHTDGEEVAFAPASEKQAETPALSGMDKEYEIPKADGTTVGPKLWHEDKPEEEQITKTDVQKGQDEKIETEKGISEGIEPEIIEEPQEPKTDLETEENVASEKAQFVWHAPVEKPHGTEKIEPDTKPEEKIPAPTTTETAETKETEAQNLIVEGDITGEDLERELFAEISETEEKDRKAADDETNKEPANTDSLKRQTAKIDKFYTFNKKNEEFQRLLDREYEKYKAGLPADEPEERMAFEERRGEELEEDWKQRDNEQVKEMAQARADFFKDESVKIEDESSDEEVQKQQEPKTEPEIKNNQQDIESEEKTEAETPAKIDNAETEAKETKVEGGENKTGTGKKVGLTILAIILIVVLVMVGIRIIAPDSSVAKQIDKIPRFFTGEQQEPKAEKVDRTKPADDKTGIIQNEIDKNIDNAIGEIAYSADLQYDDSVAYSESDIKNSKSITDNVFYTGDDGTEYYLDDAIVGAAIEYTAEKAKKKGGLDSLEIGEIRKGEKGYYIWVSENDKKEIYVVIDEKNEMKVSEVIKL